MGGNLVEFGWEVDPSERSSFLLYNLPIIISISSNMYKKSMENIIYEFLRQGGKENEKKYHMEH
jgi:hypothetical protein